jgi:hypothetical protein
MSVYMWDAGSWGDIKNKIGLQTEETIIFIVIALSN